jgi:hypothetical protein
LDADDAVRADAFRQFYERGTHDALTDLEADPVMRGWLVEHLLVVAIVVFLSRVWIQRQRGYFQDFGVGR